MWIALFLIILFAISPLIAEIAYKLWVGQSSQVYPLLILYTLPAAGVAFVVWLIVAAIRAWS